jgi:Meckel syndrome type 1 protein
MKKQFCALSCAIGLASILLGPASQYAHARGRGGFSREGPAAGGSFASRSESMRGHEGGFQASRQQYAAGAQAGRQQFGAAAQASRQQEANALQSSREQTAQRMQSNAQQYRRSYPYAGSAYPAWRAPGYPYAWDAGAGAAAAATGAAIGAAAASSIASQPSSTAGYAASQPCDTPVVVPVGDMQLFRCGSTWYRQALGPAGPTFVAVRPPGF